MLNRQRPFASEMSDALRSQPLSTEQIASIFASTERDRLNRVVAAS
jgi:hypothetical protein